MDLPAGLGANRSDTRRYREDLQRRPAGKGAVLCAEQRATPHWVSTAEAEAEAEAEGDLAKTHAERVRIDVEVRQAATRHNAFRSERLLNRC